MFHLGPNAVAPPSPNPARRALTAKYLLTLSVVTFFAAFAIVDGASAEDNENYKVAQGFGVYLGILPAGMVRGPETTMHGGVPRGVHEYHVIIAVFDAATGARVENADVTAKVAGLGHVGENQLKLEPMAIAGTVTYGGFVNLPGNDRYQIGVEIHVPGRSAPVTVEFAYEHSDTQ